MIRFAKTKRNVNKLSMLTSLYFQRVLAIIIFLCGQKQFFTTFLLPTSFINFCENPFIIPLFYAFFPQHCLYFFPLPHVQEIQVFIVFIVFMELLVFQGFVALVIKIFVVFIALSVLCLFYYLKTIWKHCVHPFT